MSAILIEIFVILVLLCLNGVFAMSEMALVAARKTRLEHRAEEGDKGARAALALAAKPDTFLSTVQVGITLVGVLAGAYAGAGIAERLAGWLDTFPVLAPYSEAIGLGVVVAAITYLSLIIGELVPKQVALGNPERVAALVARPMALLSRVAGPLVRLLTRSTGLVLRLLGMRTAVDARLTEQDIRAAVEQGAESGVLSPAEHAIIENAFRLGDRQVASVMTPRPDVPWVDVASPPDTLLDELAASNGTPLVVCEGDLEHVIGVAHPERMLRRALTGEPFDLHAVVQPPVFVPATLPALQLLEQFRRSREHVAVVLDEFGGVQGVATVDDILEALVGELPEPGDAAGPEIARQQDGSWLVHGGAALEDLEGALDLDPLPQEERRGFRTVAGLVIARLGRIAVAGDVVDVGATRLEVVAMDGRRIARVRVRRRPSDGEPA